MRALVLDGVGFEHLRVTKVPVPRPGPRQMLGRVDAAGICTSLIKLVQQGPRHPQMYGWDIERYPLILGDEGSVTIVEVGEALRGRYSEGQRYVIQPAVDHPPINHCERYRDGGRGIAKIAVGYTLAGHLAEYVLVPEEVLEAGCLLPVPRADFPYSHAALSEPLSCVISAQDHHLHLKQPEPLCPREALKGLKPGGVTVIVGAGAMGRMHVDVAFSHGPRAVMVSDPIESRLELVRSLFGGRARRAGVLLRTVNTAVESLPGVVEEVAGGAGADDVIVAVGSKAAIEESQRLTGRGGVLDLFGGLKKGEDTVGLDAGIVHYKEINVTGSSGGSPWDVARSLELMAEGQIDAGSHIGCIGDLEHSIEFLRMIMAQEISGKAVVYPHRRAARIRAVASWSASDERQYLAGGVE